jgi:signal transduction histidine kinase
MEAELGAAPLVVRARPAAVRQIVLNLVHNALDAVRGVPSASVTLGAGADASGVWLRVYDLGPGVDPAVRDHIFEAWFTTKGQEGTGLGLYLARSLARADGGDLELEDRGPGASFLVRWPPAS